MPVIMQNASGEQTLGEFLRNTLNGEYRAYHTLDAAIAFVKRSGVRHIGAALRDFLARGGKARFIIGVDQHGTSYEGLADLLEIMKEGGEVWITHDRNSYVTFHPKLYLFSGNDSALLIIGSGNLTEGGLYTNDEAALIQVLDLKLEEDVAIFNQVKNGLENWSNEEAGFSRRLDNELLDLMSAPSVRLVLREVDIQNEFENERTTEETEATAETAVDQLFQRGSNRRRPHRTTTTATIEFAPVPDQLPRGFVMTLQQTDVGVGQTHPGAGRRSPEIFIPLAARDAFPEFWGWPDLFTEDPGNPNKLDRSGVRIRMGTTIISINMMVWLVKRDLRLRSEAIRSAGNIGDILRIERSESPGEYDFDIEIIAADSPDFDGYLDLCVNPVRNSQKRWGYYG